MSIDLIPSDWSERFGLARSPMFEASDSPSEGLHSVMLDGGIGSFGLSINRELPDPTQMAAWAWSSNLPHHVAINAQNVQVVRWDAPRKSDVYSLSSVKADLDGFYRYLCKDKLQSNRTVVQHLLNLFGRIRSLVSYEGIPDERSIDVFVTILASLISPDEVERNPEVFGLPDDAKTLHEKISGETLNEALRVTLEGSNTSEALQLYPNLVIRHASGQLFQEAHFDLIRAPQPDMFGFVDIAESSKVTRGGTHFTPPALARSIVDYSISQIDDLKARRELIISDPACGSGAFLHETLRGLRRSEFNGKLNIIGQDLSEAAIAMARFTLEVALRDWSPAGGVNLELLVVDSLENDFPLADIVVMNPPYISRIAQTPFQKSQLERIVGKKAAGRGDLSMAFVTKALQSLKPEGVMGVLFPASLLTHNSAETWRNEIHEASDVRLVANIGDFGLFSQALINIACIITKKSSVRNREFTSLITQNNSEATGNALRQLRKTDGRVPSTATVEENWKLFPVSSQKLNKQRDWKILTPEQQRILDAVDSLNIPTVNDLFHVYQGVKTGSLKAFLVDESEFLNLPKRERKFFKKTIKTDSIQNGEIVKTYYMFFPHAIDGRVFDTEKDVKKAVPEYYSIFLKPNETELKNRATIIHSGRTDWWGLNRPRTFSYDTGPKIISKFFGTTGSFIADLDGELSVTTGHAWFAKEELTNLIGAGQSYENTDLISDARENIFCAYQALLNSSAFATLISFHSIIIAGGQYDLSKRFVGEVHLPNFWELYSDPQMGSHINALAESVRNPESNKSYNNRIVARLYGVPQLGEV